MTRFILEKNSTKTISTISMPFQAIYFIRGVHKIYKIGLCSVLTSLNNIFCSSCRFYFSFSNTRTFSKVDPNYSYFSPPDGLAICWLHFYVINGHQLGVAPLPMFMNHFFFSEGIFLGSRSFRHYSTLRKLQKTLNDRIRNETITLFQRLNIRTSLVF